MPAEINCVANPFSCAVDYSSFSDQPAVQHKSSLQGTVRPRLGRAATMPSTYDFENGLPVQVFSSYYGAPNAFHMTATAPTSPSSSSTTGSLASSMSDDHEYMKAYVPAGNDAMLSPKPKTSRVSKKTSSSKAAGEPKVARPPNAWILYRSKKLAEFKNSNPTMYTDGNCGRSKLDRGMRPTQASFSKQIASMWAAEPPSVKEYYHSEAALRSVVHAMENPGYRFNPNKKRADKDKNNRERSKSGSPLRPSPPLAISTQSYYTSPSLVSGSYHSPAIAMSSSLALNGQDQTSPWRQHEHQWALTPPVFAASTFVSPSTDNTSSLDSPYAQERRPSLKAQWEAIFPNEGSDQHLSAPPCTSSFPGAFVPSVSPIWETNLLPSLSINEPLYTGSHDNSLQVDLPGATPLNFNSPPSGLTTPVALTSPAQYAFVPPALSVPSVSSSPEFAYWSPMSETAGNLSSISSTSSIPAMVPSIPTFDNLLVPHRQPSDVELWQQYRHIKVKRDETDGVPLEELLRDFESNKSQ